LFGVRRRDHDCADSGGVHHIALGNIAQPFVYDGYGYLFVLDF